MHFRHAIVPLIEELFNSFSKISDRLIKIPTILAIVVIGSKAYGS